MYWKAYFIIYLLLTVLGLLSMVEYAPLAVFDVISIFISLILIAGLYAYVYKKELLSKTQWTVFFYIIVFSIIETLLSTYILPTDFYTNINPALTSKIPTEPIYSLFSWIFSSPSVYALYKLTRKK